LAGWDDGLNFEVCCFQDTSKSVGLIVREMSYLQRVEEEIIPHTTKPRKVNSIGHFLPRDSFLKNVNEGEKKYGKTRMKA